MDPTARHAITVTPDTDTLSRVAAERWTALARQAAAEHGAFFVALAGGSTPRGLYRALAAPEFAERVPWERTHVFFGDERSVPPDHPDSNYRMAAESLLNRVPVPHDQVHPMRAEPATIRQDAHAYAELLRRVLPQADDGTPVFDLVLLGMGPDGHTASLFPRTCILHETERPVAAVYVDRLRTWRISLTYPVLERARHLMFLAAGEGKAEILRRVLAEPPGPEPLPVQRIRPRGRAEWFMDAAAARRLPRRDAP